MYIFIYNWIILLYSRNNTVNQLYLNKIHFLKRKGLPEEGLLRHSADRKESCFHLSTPLTPPASFSLKKNDTSTDILSSPTAAFMSPSSFTSHTRFNLASFVRFKQLLFLSMQDRLCAASSLHSLPLVTFLWWSPGYTWWSWGSSVGSYNLNSPLPFKKSDMEIKSNS